MPRKLKVFRTSTGFHDAYVAAPSRKAALAAWGVDADLFARGVAEEVSDPKLVDAALARPGEVIRLSRGDLAAQLKALPPKRKQTKADAEEPPAPARRPKKLTPPPKRAKVDAADKALGEARRRHEAEAAELRAQREAVERKLAALQAAQDKEIARLERRLEAARAAYREALEAWSG
ncbi:MAG TPA: hypothetical protein VNB28_02175 [Methylomirabilota bacterium]|nr:hypothetical protein [Methylomirabilota bacterium]